MKKLLLLIVLFAGAAQAQPTYRLPHFTLGRWWLGAEDSMTTRAGKFDTTYTDRITVRNASELIVAAKTRYESTDNVPFAIRNTTAAGAGLSVIQFQDYLGTNKGDIGYGGPSTIMRIALNSVDLQFRQSGAAELMRLLYDGRLALGLTAPHALSLFEGSSTTKFFRPPQMTTTQRNAAGTCATGHFFWNTTTGQMEACDGGTWESMGGSTPAGGDYEIQIGIAGAPATDAGFTMNPTTDLLTTPGRIDGGGDITQPDCDLAGGTAWDRAACPQIYDVLAANRDVTTSNGQDGSVMYKARITQNGTGNFSFALNSNNVPVNPAASSVTNIYCHRVNTTEYCYSDYAPPGTPNAQVGTTYEFVLADKDRATTLTNGAAITATIPPNSTVAYPIGSVLTGLQGGAGAVTIAPGAGVTLNAKGADLTLSGQWALFSCLKTATNTWVCGGGF